MRILSIRDVTQEKNKKIKKRNANWEKIFGKSVVKIHVPIDNKCFSFCTK